MKQNDTCYVDSLNFKNGKEIKKMLRKKHYPIAFQENGEFVYNIYFPYDELKDNEKYEFHWLFYIDSHGDHSFLIVNK